MLSHRILVPLVLILLSPFIFATSPTLPPYHQFHVSGRVERSSGASKKDFSVALFAKPLYRIQSSDFEIMRGIGKEYDRPIAITDSTGSFSLVTSSQDKPDSIVIGVVVPERPTCFGQRISAASLHALPYTFVGEYNDNDLSGCNGCHPTPKKYTVTKYYSYSLQDLNVVIPY